MSCIKDVEKAILDKAFKDVIDGRNSYKRISPNQFIVTPNTKNKSKEFANQQAKQMAKSAILRIANNFNGHIRGYVSQNDLYSPVVGTIEVNPEYINYVFNTQVENINKNILFSTSTIDQDQVNNNSGPNTEDRLNQEDYVNPTVGYFTKFIQFRENLLNDYESRLRLINKKLSSKITSEELKSLNKEKRLLELELNGNNELNKKGLRQEVNELKTKANTLSIGYYAEKDLLRLNKLVKSNNLEDLNEAKRIADFYIAAGTFKISELNPFFSKEDMFLKDEDGEITPHYKISNEDRQIFAQWKDKAIDEKNKLDKKFEDEATRIINSDVAIKNLYNKTFTLDELTFKNKGLKDTNWIDMWTMDITNGIFSQNGVLPQVMFSQIANSITKEKQYALAFEERVNHLNPIVLDKLKNLGFTLKAKGVDGVSQGVYTIFLEKNINGQLTGKYATKYTNDYFNDLDIIKNKFSEEYNGAKLIDDFQTRQTAYKRAFASKRNWNRGTNIIIEFNKLPELISDEEFKDYSDYFNSIESEKYKKYITSIIGEKEYSKILDEQRRLLRKYKADKENIIDTLLEEQGVTSIEEFSDSNKLALERWTKSNSPFHGLNDYYAVNFDDVVAGNFQNYNLFIPRKNKAKILVSEDKKTISFEDLDDKVVKNYYNNEFEDYIEKDEDLYKFHLLLSEAMNYVKSVAPPEIANKLAFNYLSTLDKTSAEIITANNDTQNVLSRISPAFKVWLEKLRLGFGVSKQNDISYEELDPITNKPNYTVNDSFIRNNTQSIEDKITIENIKFLQAIKGGFFDDKMKFNKISNIKKFTTIPFSSLNTNALILLSRYTNTELSLVDIEQGRTEILKKKLGNDVHIGKIIRDYAIHETVKEQSFDLAKIIKHFTNMAALYSARTQAKPKIDLLKNYYENIDNIKLNNVSEPVFNIPNAKNEVEGYRTNAIKQMQSWYERVVLDSYGEKHSGVIGYKDEDKLFGEKIYSKKEREQLKEINKSIDEISKDVSKTNNEEEIKLLQDRINKLQKIKEGLGKTRTTTAAFNNLLSWVRTMRLGWNLSSGVTNLIEGYMTNMMVASTGDYFNPNNVYYAYGVVKHSFIKNITFGKAETGLAKRNRMLMDMFDILMDSKNELQKSSIKTFSDKFEKFNPYALNQRVEYINQSVLMISILKDVKIKDKNGNESSVWDAYNPNCNRQLKEEFRTAENIDNWETLNGDEYHNFKEKLRKVIVLAHGNYDELRGMMSKSNSTGKALMMFKTWLPQQIYWRFATEQDDIQAGTVKFKGKYWSYGPGSAGLHGAALGLTFLGPMGLAIGGGLGAFGGLLARQKLNKGYTGDDNIGLLKETLVSTQVLVKKMLGMPINSITGRTIIDASGKELDIFIGKGHFTKQDANALKANMADIAMQLTWIALIILVKSMFWDDDDDKDAPERIAHNILVNKLMQLASQATLYINPVEGHKSTVGSVAVVSYLSDVFKTVEAANGAIHGEDEIKSGVNKGESKLANTAEKAFVPGMFKLNLLGFESLGKRQFQPSPFDNKIDITKERKELKEKLEGEGVSKKKIKEELDNKLPTKKKLKKANTTRKDWIKLHNNKN